MLFTNTILRSAENFNDALNRIERANGTDRTVTSSRQFDNICDTLKACTDVATFNKNVKREVYRLNSDVDTTDLLTVLDGVRLDNSVRSAQNARGSLSHQCNNSIEERGSLATYKTARNHYQAQRARNETVAKSVCKLVAAECQPGQTARNLGYNAAFVEGDDNSCASSYAIVCDDERCHITFQSNPGKDVRNALKAAGFTASTTSCIMYCDVEGRSFEEIATLAIDAITAVDSKNQRQINRRIRSSRRTRAALAD